MQRIYLVGLSVSLSMSVACGAQPDQVNEESPATPAPSGEEGSKPAPKPKPKPNPGPSPKPEPAPAPVCTPLRGPGTPPGTGKGMADPAAVYCLELGYALVGDSCTFPDGTRCGEWSFFRGMCGQAHSFCDRHGGKVSTKLEDMGSWTAEYALCTLPSGASCKEQAFATTCRCE